MKTFIEPGARVIIRSNTYDEQYHLGEFVRWGDDNLSHIPVVKSYKDNKEYVCFSIVIFFNRDLVAILDKLTPKEQWEILSAGAMRIIKD